MNGRCKRAIACDVRKGPLERAQRTLDQYDLHEKMELRLGSGLEPLSSDEADCVVLAGMGGILITGLLENSLITAQKASCIILQPMVGQELVRPFLWQRGFEVVDEGLAREGEKIYQALSVHYTGNIRESWRSIDEVIGEILVRKKDPLLQDWIRERIKRQSKIVRGLRTAKSPAGSLQKEEELLCAMKEML
jgi:tRNA (adenine22-N1)-methyltransferase